LSFQVSSAEYIQIIGEDVQEFFSGWGDDTVIVAACSEARLDAAGDDETL